MADLIKFRQAVDENDDVKLKDLIDTQWSIGYFFGLGGGSILTAIVMYLIYG